MRRPGCRCREDFDGRSKGVITKGPCSGRRALSHKVYFGSGIFFFLFLSFMPFTKMVKDTNIIDCIPIYIFISLLFFRAQVSEVLTLQICMI